MKVLVASPRGFCAGVVMAIDALDRALELLGAPIYVYHEIVHNKYVVERFRRQGVVFVETPEEVERLQVADPNKLAYLTQTTLSVDDANRVIDALRRRFPDIQSP